MPLLWLSLAFLAGILLGGLLQWSLSAWLILSALALALLLLRLLLPRLFSHALRLPSFFAPPLPFPFLVLILALGALRFQSTRPVLSPSFIAWYNDLQTKFIIEGVLVEPPDERDLSLNLRIRADQLRPVDEPLFKPVRGLLLVQTSLGEKWRYGDRIRLEGQLRTPPEDEDFSYRAYLARQGVYAYMRNGRASLLLHNQGNKFWALVYEFKERAFTTIYHLFPDPEASLLAGILLGVDTYIPSNVQEAFKSTGTSHIIAISGFNMTILSALFVSIFSRLPGPGARRRRVGAFVAILCITLYTLLVGASPSVVRSAIMAGLSLFARQVGRRQDGLNSLAFVAAVMALFTPDILGDVGFQLSFMATLGLVLYADPFAQAFTSFASRYLPVSLVQRIAGPVGEYFLFTLAAQLTTLPVTIYYFRRLSLISLLANPLILPAQPAVMILGGLALLVGMAYLPLGRLLASLAWPFVAYTIRIVEQLAKIPGGGITLGNVTLPVVILFYVLLFGLTFAAPRLQRLISIVKPSLAFAILSIITMITWKAAFSVPDSRLHLILLDAGGGDALLVQTPKGRSLLVNGGARASLLSEALGRRLPAGNRVLDWLVVAAADNDHLSALPRTLERFPVANVLWAGPPTSSGSARELQANLSKSQVPIITAWTGHTLDLGGGASLRVLAAGNRGSVLLLAWRNFHALLPIGLDFDSMETLQNDPNLGMVDVLLLAEGGYAPVNPPEWIARLRPQVVLVSVAVSDPRGLPDSEVLETLAGYNLLRTDRNGWIHLSTDGEKMWVEVERK